MSESEHVFPFSLVGLERSAQTGALEGVEVTLLVGGALVEGNIVSPTTYWRHIASAIRTRGNNDGVVDPEASADELERLVKEDMLAHPEPESLHLRDAVVTSGGSSQNVGWFSVANSGVDGMTLGRRQGH